jgi:8-oxo-dGTP pyrophosphatase MutT (NUDIX family)
MLQMYKVFFNNKALYFSREPLLNDMVGQSLDAGSGEVDLDGIIQKMMEEDGGAKHIELYGEDVEARWKEFQKKVIPIEAAGGIVRNETGFFLFICRHGKWDIPKGKREKGESIEDCAEREIKEECGIVDILLEDKIAETLHTYVKKGNIMLKRTHWYSFLHKGMPGLSPQLDEDISEAKWLTKPQVENMVLKNTYLSIKDVVAAMPGLGTI